MNLEAKIRISVTSRCEEPGPNVITCYDLHQVPLPKDDETDEPAVHIPGGYLLLEYADSGESFARIGGRVLNWAY